MEDYKKQLSVFRSEGGSWIRRKIADPQNQALCFALTKKYKCDIEQAIYLCWENLTAIPQCLNCNEVLKFRTLKSGYGKYCSISCSAKHTSKQAQETKVLNGTSADFGSAKFSKAMKEKYGFEHAGQVPLVKEKIKETMQDRYGVVSGFNLVTDRSAAVSEDANNKRIKTNIERFGAPNVLDSALVRDKIKQTMITRHGVENPMFSEGILKKMQESKRISWVNRRLLALSSTVQCLNEPSEVLNKDTMLQWKCCSCSAIFLSNLDDGKTPICRACHKNNKIGGALRNKFLSLIGDLGTYRLDDRTVLKPLELDIYWPACNLAVEINGLYWHGENIAGQKHKEYKKFILAKEQGIRVLNIWEDEILNKPAQIASLVRASHGQFETRVYARNLHVIELSSSECSKFIVENHIQGPRGGSLRLALADNEKIYACMVIGASRFSKQHQYELIRFCNLLDTQVLGGFSKLLSAAKKRISGSMVTYADMRLFTGDAYTLNGFKFMHATKPGFCWTDYGTRYDRTKFQRHKLNTTLSGPEQLFADGYDRLWDCGQGVFETEL